MAILSRQQDRATKPKSGIASPPPMLTQRAFRGDLLIDTYHNLLEQLCSATNEHHQGLRHACLAMKRQQSPLPKCLVGSLLKIECAAKVLEHFYSARASQIKLALHDACISSNSSPIGDHPDHQVTHQMPAVPNFDELQVPAKEDCLVQQVADISFGKCHADAEAMQDSSPASIDKCNAVESHHVLPFLYEHVSIEEGYGWAWHNIAADSDASCADASAKSHAEPKPKVTLQSSAVTGPILSRSSETRFFRFF